MTEQEFRFPMGKKELAPSGTPLRRFTGELADVKQLFDTQRNRYVAKPQFVEVEVLETVEGAVYPYEIAELTFNASDRRGRVVGEGSPWGHLLSTLPDGVDSITELVGKRLTMSAHRHVYQEAVEAGTNPDGTNREAQEEMAGLQWEVVAVDGGVGAAASADPHELLLDLLHGKTAGQFSQAMLQHPVLKSQQAALMDGTLLSGLVDAGEAVMDGDTYQVAGR